MNPDQQESANFPVGAVPSGVWEEGQRKRAEKYAGVFLSQLEPLTAQQREIIFEALRGKYCMGCGLLAPCNCERDQ